MVQKQSKATIEKSKKDISAKEVLRRKEAIMARCKSMPDMMTNTPINRRCAHGGVLPKRTLVRKQMLQHQLDALRYSSRNFRIKTAGLDAKPLALLKALLNKETEKMEDTMPHRNWEFEVPHGDVICMDEVTKYVTRDNPVVILSSNSYIVVLVHTSIVLKAKLIDYLPWELQQTQESHIFGMTTKHMHYKDIIEWARHIKRASWGDAKCAEDVRVIVPKI